MTNDYGEKEIIQLLSTTINVLTLEQHLRNFETLLIKALDQHNLKIVKKED